MTSQQLKTLGTPIYYGLFLGLAGASMIWSNINLLLAAPIAAAVWRILIWLWASEVETAEKRRAALVSERSDR